MIQRTLIAALALCLSALASAEPMADASQALCEKVKACSLAEINEADMTPEMREMMEPMLENMCANMRAGVEEVFPLEIDLRAAQVAVTREDESAVRGVVIAGQHFDAAAEAARAAKAARAGGPMRGARRAAGTAGSRQEEKGRWHTPPVFSEL